MDALVERFLGVVKREPVELRCRRVECCSVEDQGTTFVTMEVDIQLVSKRTSAFLNIYK